MALKRDGILKAPPTKLVHIPELKDENGDDAVIVRGMSLHEFEQLGNAAPGDAASARLLAKVILDENGEREFSDSDEDVQALNQLPLAAAVALIEAVNELSGLGDTKEKQAALDEAVAGESEAQTSSSS